MKVKAAIVVAVLAIVGLFIWRYMNDQDNKEVDLYWEDVTSEMNEIIITIASIETNVSLEPLQKFWSFHDGVNSIIDQSNRRDQEEITRESPSLATLEKRFELFQDKLKRWENWDKTFNYSLALNLTSRFDEIEQVIDSNSSAKDQEQKKDWARYCFLSHFSQNVNTKSDSKSQPCQLDTTTYCKSRKHWCRGGENAIRDSNE